MPAALADGGTRISSEGSPHVSYPRSTTLKGGARMSNVRKSLQLQAREARVDRAVAEARKRHPGDDITIETTFFGPELYIDVWQKGERATIARYIDVVDDLEAELTHPGRAV